MFDEESSAESTIFLEDEHCSSIEEMSTMTLSDTDDSFFVSDDDTICIESSDEMEEEISEKVDKASSESLKNDEGAHQQIKPQDHIDYQPIADEKVCIRRKCAFIWRSLH